MQSVKQGGTLNINLSLARSAVLHVTSAWQDHCDVRCSEQVAVFENDGIGYVNAEQQPHVEVHVTVPEIINV